MNTRPNQNSAIELNQSNITDSAILVHVTFRRIQDPEALAEFEHLVLSTGATIAALVTHDRDAPDPKFFVGTGKATEIAELVALHKASVVIFNHSLSPAQERNLEKCCSCHVIDRTRLILDIFARRAQSFVGKLQVELAQLQHMATRLVRGWTHLERQKGGIGLRGPGETQLETDRRLLRQRIKTIKQRLSKVHQQRQQAKRARTRAHVPTVALVGYTNAGKSSLFNVLVNDSTYVADQLFATLDPTLRRLVLPGIGTVILADTVGFIRDLPHELIEAFQATLEETKEADLLLHVIDCQDPNAKQHINAVHQVLEQINAHQIPRIEIYNKIDAVPGLLAHSETNALGLTQRIWLSARCNLGLEFVHAALALHLQQGIHYHHLRLPPTAGALRARLYAEGAVIKEETDDTGYALLVVRLHERDYVHVEPFITS